MFSTWLKSLAGNSSSSATPRKGEHNCKPQLELLEDRSVPATLSVIPNVPATNMAQYLVAGTGLQPNNATLMVNTPPGPPGPFVPSGAGDQHAGTFSNGKPIIGLNRGIVIGGWNIGILPIVYNNPGPSPSVDVFLSFQFVPHASIATVRIVMASDEFSSFAAPPFPDQVGIYVNGSQKAFVPGTGAPISPPNIPASLLLYNENFIPPFPFPIPGAAAPYEIDVAGFTKPITVNLPVHPNQVNTVTFAETTTYDLLFPTWMFVETLHTFNGPKITGTNPYNWIFQPSANAFSGLVTIKNIGDFAFTAGDFLHPGTTALYVTLPGLPAGSTIISAGGTFLPGTSIPAVKLPVKTIAAGQTIAFQILITDPYNLALPTIFQSTPQLFAK
jgi:hypothetical protein